MSHRQELIIGIVLGFLMSFLISTVVFLTTNPGFTMADYFNIFVNGKLLAPILSVALVGNLGLFFLFLKLDKDIISKGVLASTILIGILIFVMKFM